MGRDRRLRVFIDTNLIFSAVHSPLGIPADLLRSATSGVFRWEISPAALEETVRNVTGKLPDSGDRLELLLGGAGLEVVPNASHELYETLAAPLGTQDAALVAAAIEAHVDYFVTGDKRLVTKWGELGLAGPRFTSPRDLLSRLQSNP